MYEISSISLDFTKNNHLEISKIQNFLQIPLFYEIIKKT